MADIIEPDLDLFTEPHLGRSALLTIDMQVDFTEPGPFQVAGTSEVLPQLVGLAEAFRSVGRPIFHLIRLYGAASSADRCRRGLLSAGASLVRPGSAGSELAPGLTVGSPLDADRLLQGKPQDVGPGEVILFKPRWSAFYRTCLEDELARLAVDTVVIGGCNYPNCPRGTAFDASQRDYRVLMVSDAISGWSDRAAEDMARIGVGFSTAAQLIAQLEGVGAKAPGQTHA